MEIERRLRKSGVSPHFWERHELENYLLAPGAIARVSGADEAWIEGQLAILVDGFEDEVYSGIYAEHQRRLRRTGVDDGAIGKQAKRAADAAWAEGGRRIELAPGKELLGALISPSKQRGARLFERETSLVSWRSLKFRRSCVERCEKLTPRVPRMVAARVPASAVAAVSRVVRT
jgi:hypothetical protein